MKRSSLVILAMCLGITQAVAADLGPYPKKKPLPAPAQGSTTTFDPIERKLDPIFQPSAAVYVGALGGYGVGRLSSDDFDPKDKNAEFGVLAGYSIRAFQMWQLGIEADYMRTSLKFDPDCPKDDPLKSAWSASLRGTVGLYLTDTVMAFGTAGWAWSDLGEPGPVWGGGLALALTDRVSVRGEALRYEYDGVAAARDVVRGGITYKLN